MRRRWLPVLFCAPISLILACSAGGGSSLEDGYVGGTGASTGKGTGTGNTNDTFDPSTSGGPDGNCSTQLAIDDDNDGFTDNEGDCNDCDANVNPGAVEVATPMGGGGGSGGAGGAPEPADENCDTQIDEAPVVCDSNLALNDTSPVSAANALGLCATTTMSEKTHGIISALWMRANGTPATAQLNTGNLNGFGPNVLTREGGRFAVLSSGHARTPSMPGACGSLTCSINGPGTPPPGFPAAVPNCPGASNINDDIALEVQMRAPTNATGYSFDFSFYSFEYPEWVCTSYNDQFIALVDPPPMGAQNGNITFDSMNNPVSVNIAFFQVCQGCPLGTAELQGTGFDVWNDAGATGWLVTTAPVNGGEVFKIRFAIWDTGDAAWDSTVLIDNFRWIANSGTNVVVGTNPVPE